MRTNKEGNVCVRKANTSHVDVTLNTQGMRTSSSFHKLPVLPHKRATAVSASHLYLHASSSCRSTGVHGLDVTGFAASDHKAPAHSITNNLGAKRQQKKRTDVRSCNFVFSCCWHISTQATTLSTSFGGQFRPEGSRPLAWETWCGYVKGFTPLYTALEGEWPTGGRNERAFCN